MCARCTSSANNSLAARRLGFGLMHSWILCNLAMAKATLLHWQQLASDSDNRGTHARGVHEQRKDHARPQCYAALGEAGDLRTHDVRAVHEQRRDHACPQCDAAFGKASNLRAHMRTVHEQRKDHACPQCDTAFGRADHLRTHVCTVHEQRKQQLGGVAPGIWSHALLDLVQSGKGKSTITLATASF